MELSNRIFTPKTSATYQTVDTTALVNKLQAERLPLDMDNAKFTQGAGTTHYLTVPLQGLLKIGGDDVAPNILIKNSYNGECSLQVMVGFIRLACANGMIVGNAHYSQGVRHVKGGKVETFLRNFTDVVGQAIGELDVAFSHAENLVDFEVSSKYIRQTLELLVSRGVITKKAAEHVNHIYDYHQFRRAEDWSHRSNMFGLWNVINEELRITASSRTTQGRLIERNLNLSNQILTAYTDIEEAA